MNLRWNTSEYGNVRDLRIPPHRLWKPDVLMYNRQVPMWPCETRNGVHVVTLQPKYRLNIDEIHSLQRRRGI